MNGYFDFNLDGLVGEIKLWPSNELIPRNWMICDGRELKRNEFSLLFSMIGTNFGGNGNPMFKIPNLKDRTLMGSKNFKTGENRGSNQITLTKDQLPAHDHHVRVGVKSGEVTDTTSTSNKGIINTNAGAFSYSETPLAVLGGVTQDNQGGADPIDITNPRIGLHYIICTTGHFFLGS